MARISSIVVSHGVSKYPVAEPLKVKQGTVAKQAEVKPKVQPTIKAERQQEKPKEELKPADKGKAKAGSGKLDFFKPKAKETKKEEISKTAAAKMFFSAPKKDPKEVTMTAVYLVSDNTYG